MDAAYDEPSRVGELLFAAGQAAAAAADLSAARTAYAALRQHGERHADPAAVLRGSLGLVQTFANERIDEDVLDRLAAALELVLGDDAATRAATERPLVAEGIAVLTTYRPPVARELRRRAAAGDPGAELALLARVWEQEAPAEQAAILTRMVELDGPPPRLGTAMRTWITVVIGSRALGDDPPGWTPSDGAEPERWEAALWQITVAIATGRFERAERLLGKADELARRAGSPLEHAARAASLLGQRTWLAYLRADLEALVELLANNPPNWTVRRPIHRVMQTFSAAMLLSPEEAWQVCDAVVEEFLDGAAPGRHQLAPVIALSNGCIEVGHRRGIELCRDLLRAARGRHAVYWVVQYWGCAEYHLGRRAAAVGEYDEAVERFDEALAIYRAAGARCFEAFTIRALATVQYFRGRGDDRRVAEELNGEARRLGAQIGMPQVADAVWPPIGPLDLRPRVPLIVEEVDALAEADGVA
jgi:tetratricopeptide (TPR) repeat protein